MTERVDGCIGHFDFEQILYFARKRFVEGTDTVTLLQQASTEVEKEEIVLVSLLNVEDDELKALELNCPHAYACQVTDCRERLKRMFKAQLERERGLPQPEPLPDVG